MQEFLIKAKKASYEIQSIRQQKKNDLLRALAKKFIESTEVIKVANTKDLNFAKANKLSPALIDRLMLDDQRIETMAQSLKDIAMLPDPVNKILDHFQPSNGLNIQKVSVPIGVIGIIYESRPNVTVDVAGLCLKSNNVAILKGGKEAIHSNQILVQIIREVLVSFNLNPDFVSLLPDTSRKGVQKFITQSDFIDLIIPRGGSELIKFVQEHAKVPVIKHDKGLCHIFVDSQAQLDEAVAIVVNAKTQRTGVCNALETLLVHTSIAPHFLPKLAIELAHHQTEIRACKQSLKFIQAKIASEEDWHTEYLDNILSIKVVQDVEKAITHINTYGSGHSDAILSRRL